MRNRKTTVVLAGGLSLVSLAALYLTLVGLPPRVDSRIHTDVGRALAEQAVKLLGPGGRLTVVTRDTETFKQPAEDLTLAGFTRRIDQAGATVVALQKLQVDPLRPVQVPPGDFLELIRRGAAGDVIVSFMGPPLLSEEQRTGLGEIKPKIVALCSGTLPETVNLRLLAEQNLLHAAVLSRPQKLSAARPATRLESFDALYLSADRTVLGGLNPSATVSGARP